MRNLGTERHGKAGVATCLGVRRAAARLALISAAVIAALLASAAPASAQTDIRQDFPLEGTPGEIPVGPDITRCGGSPDYGPFFGSVAEAFSGDTFVGFHESLGPGSPAETFSLPIEGSTAAGEDYRYGFMARIAPINVNSAAWIASNQGANSGTFRVFAGASACGLGQLIGTVNMTWPGDNQWLAQQLEFTADGAYEHLTFQASGGLSSGNATYFGIDDAVAQLQKEFTPDQVSLGETSTLNFTIQNVDGLPAQAGWSFTDNLPAGVKVASPNGTTDCTNGTVTAELDGDSVTVSGDLDAGQASCAASVTVMATDVGTHLNDHQNFSDLVGISPPPPAELTCTDPPDPETGDLVGVFVDCDFSDEPPENDFTIQQDWESPGDEVASYQTPVVGDIYGTGKPAVVVGSNRGLTGGSVFSGRVANDLKIYDGATGDLLHTIATPRYSWTSHSVATLADVNEDGRAEIIFRAASHSQRQEDAAAAGVATPNGVVGRLIAYTYDPVGDDWDVMWVSDKRYDHGETLNTSTGTRTGFSVSVADFNADGAAEIYVGNEIFNALTGVRLLAGGDTQPSGCQFAAHGCYNGQSVAADMNGDGDLELVAGRAAYDVELSNLNGEAGNSITIAAAADPTNSSVRDGFTAVADMDLDGDPDVVVSGRLGGETSETVLYVWDGQTDEILGMRTGTQMVGSNGSRGGAPLIGDIDGDERPEIVIVTTSRLRAFGLVPGAGTLADGLNEQWTLGTNDGSGATSLSMFDFNNDGRQELVYRDQSNLRIVDGGPEPTNTNRNLATFGCTSGTGTEMPVIADIDGSLEARIVVACGNDLRAYESASFAWANTRPVWNQQAYFVAHINDDLTVPANQFEHWTVFSDPEHRCSDGANRPLNAFQQQVTDLDSETGCPVICVPPSLEVDKTSDPASGAAVQPGDTIDYTVAIENTSSADVTDVDLTDDLTDVLDDATITSGPTVDPPGAGTAQINGNELAFNGTIPQGETVTITYEATVKPRGELGDRMLENSVIGEFSNCDGVTGRLRCTTEHPVAVPETDLALTKSADPQLVSPGGQISYLLTVTNIGPDASTGGTVTDTLPDGVTVVAFPQDDCELEGQTLTCEVGPLATSDAQGYQILVEAPDTPSTCFENVASVEAADDDLEPGNDEATVRACTTPVADLEIEKSGDPPVVSQGAQVTYTLTVTNDGPDGASNVVVTDDLPAGVTPVGPPPPGCNFAGQPGNFTVTCNIGAVPVGATPTIEITVIAPNTPGCFENVASVAGEEGDPDLANNESEPVQTCAREADVELEKTVDPPLVDPGGEATYTLTVTNHGPDQSPGSTVTDDLPAGLTNVQVPQGCELQGLQVTCTVGPLDPDAETEFVITADAPDAPATCFSNDASVEGEFDPSPGNDEASARACTTPAADLELQKSAAEEVDPGGEVTWTLTVINHGPQASTGGVVTDTVPAGITNVQVPQDCDLQGITITCDVGPLDPDQSTPIQITGTAPDDPETCFSNGASVAIDDDDPDESDPNLENNEASVETCTNEGANLDMAKVAGPAPHLAGEVVTYTLTVTNLGPAIAHDVAVSDDLPGSLTLVSATPQQGSCNDADPLECELGTIAPDEVVEIEVVATIGGDQSGEEIANTACAEGSVPDPADGNNCATEPIDIEPEADLRIAKTVEPTQAVRVGDKLTYTLLVENLGPNEAASVTLGDALAGRVEVVSIEPSQGTCSGEDPVTCQLGAIASGESATITVTVRPLERGQLENCGAVASATFDPDESNDEDCVSVRVKPARVDIRKVASRRKVGVGKIVRYEIRVRSRSGVALENVKVCDKLPKQLRLVAAPGAKVNGRKACWTVDLNPRASRTFVVRAKAKPTDHDRRATNRATINGPDVAGKRAKERVLVKGEGGSGGPGPCPGARVAARC